MHFDNTKEKKRKSIRIPYYNYSQNGYYFVTICTHQKAHLFGKIENNIMIKNEIAQKSEKEFFNITLHREYIKIDSFVVMPNHIHAIIIIENKNISGRGEPWHAPINDSEKSHNKFILKSDSLGSIINQYKGAVKRWANKNQHEYFQWQKNYHEHIIRDQKNLEKIQEYIKNNPALWSEDCYNHI